MTSTIGWKPSFQAAPANSGRTAARAPRFSGASDHLEISGEGLPKEIGYLHTGARVSKAQAQTIRQTLKQYLRNGKPGETALELYELARHPWHVPDSKISAAMQDKGILTVKDQFAGFELQFADEAFRQVVLASFVNPRRDGDTLIDLDWVPDNQLYLPPEKTIHSEMVTLRSGESIPLSRLVKIQQAFQTLMTTGDIGRIAIYALIMMTRQETPPLHQAIQTILTRIGLADEKGQLPPDVLSVVSNSFEEVPGKSELESYRQVESTRIPELRRKMLLVDVGGYEPQAEGIAQAIGINGDLGYETLVRLAFNGIVGNKLTDAYNYLFKKNLRALVEAIFRQDTALLALNDPTSCRSLAIPFQRA